MEYRRLGSSDVTVSVITFGAWAIGGWMWGKQDESDAIAAIETALDEGVTSIDTAPVYGFGYSEEIIGRVLSGRKRQAVQLLTKYGLRWEKQEGEFFFEPPDTTGRPVKIFRNARKADVIAECEQSLQRLRTDYIDLYQCHWRDGTTPVAETMAAMDALLKDGKIRAAGVSNFAVEEIDEARKVIPLASYQGPYSMIRRDMETNILPFCREHDLGVLAYSPLQRGLLTGKFTEDHQYAEGDNRAKSQYFKPENIRRVNAMLKEIGPIASAHKATVAQVVIHWTLLQPGITAALVGARNAKQAKENAHAVAFTLTREEVARIDELASSLKLDLTKR
ncbi:MAG: aldo/keto reductase [Phycisphaerae bacterium]|nr:aldo/keto reductase [Phycisphaerae bacterium]